MKKLFADWMESRNDRIQFVLDVFKTLLCTLQPLLHLLQGSGAPGRFGFQSIQVGLVSLDFVGKVLPLVDA